MKNIFRALLAAAWVAALPLAVTQAQTRKPAAKPAARPAVKPAPKPAPARAAAPAPAPAAPTPAPAPAPAARAVRPTTARSTATGTGTEPFSVGTTALNLGIGVGSRYGYGAGLFGGNSSVSPALSISLERGIMPLGPGVLGVGVFAGYQGASYDFGGGDKWKFTDVIVTVRGAFHYPVSPQFDAYGGLGLGLRHAGVSVEGNSFLGTSVASANEFASGLFLGGRYFFTPSIGAFAELGYDQSYLKVGLAAKF